MNLIVRIGQNSFMKLISSILFIFILLATILIKQNPIAGYELNIYDAIPVSVWVLLLLAIIGGIGIVVNQAAINSGKKAKFGWQIGLLLILLSNLEIVLLLYLRGYAYLCTGDHLSHIGYAKSILQTGFIISKNVYPITHITISQLSSILGISVHSSKFYWTFILSLIRPIYISLVTRDSAQDRRDISYYC